MKKTYIAPEAFSISLDPKTAFLLDAISAVGEEGQFTKEYVSDDGTTGGGSKNIWDEEW